MTDADYAYFSVRFLEEQRRAQNADCQEAAAVHNRLAHEYRLRLESNNRTSDSLPRNASNLSEVFTVEELLASRLSSTIGP